jgi:3-mercaptopyruvate sulfurtransferase SseA
VKLYKGSQHEWLQDPRQLPMWTYSAPALMRDTAWVAGWGGPMLRAFGFSNLAVIDVRAPQAYGAGHVPFALNIPAATFARHAGDAAALAAVLGPAGVSASHEAIIVSEGGITPDAALALAVLEQAGHKRVSILMDSVDDWGLKGQPIAKEPTLVGRPTSPQQRAVPPATYTAAPRADGPLVSHHNAANSVYPKVYLAAGAERPAKAPHGTLVHVPYKQLLNADGTPKPAKDLWSLLARAGVPRYAQIVCVADNPGEAAAAYYVLKLMGFADVKVLLA